MKVLPTITIAVLALAPMYIFAGKINSDEFTKTIWAAILVGAALGINKIAELYKG